MSELDEYYYRTNYSGPSNDEIKIYIKSAFNKYQQLSPLVFYDKLQKTSSDYRKKLMKIENKLDRLIKENTNNFNFLKQINKQIDNIIQRNLKKDLNNLDEFLEKNIGPGEFYVCQVDDWTTNEEKNFPFVYKFLKQLNEDRKTNPDFDLSKFLHKKYTEYISPIFNQIEPKKEEKINLIKKLESINKGISDYQTSIEEIFRSIDSLLYRYIQKNPEDFLAKRLRTILGPIKKCRNIIYGYYENQGAINLFREIESGKLSEYGIGKDGDHNENN